MTEKQRELLDGKLIEKHVEMMEKEWFAPFNQLLSLDPMTISCGCTRTAYWKCPKCQNIYRMPPRDRILRKYRNQESCYYCRGRRQAHSFAM